MAKTEKAIWAKIKFWKVPWEILPRGCGFCLCWFQWKQNYSDLLTILFLILSPYKEISGNSMLLFSKVMSSNHKIWIWMPNGARSSGEFGPRRLAQASVECFPRIFWRPIQGFQREERHVQHGRVTEKHRLEFPGFFEIKIVNLISLRKLALCNFHFVLKKHEKLKIEWKWKN